MTIAILTLFPQVFESVFAQSIVARAISKKLLKIKIVNIRDFARDKHKTVDDTPYGGGSGMIMKVDILYNALKSIKPKPYTILLSASGTSFTQNKAQTLAKKKNVALVCGHYEGIDARFEKYAHEIISIGDYILTGGEIPAMVVVDTLTRFIPGSISPKSPIDESFKKGLLEYPQYTKPKIFKDQQVPSILLSGNHKKIGIWRGYQAQIRTKIFRPSLLKK